VARYKMDDVSGSTAVATVGTNGTYVGSPTLGATGIVSDGGTAVTMDGNTQEMTHAISTSAGAVKTFLWTFKTTDTSSVILFRDDNSSAGTGTFVQLGSGTLGISTRLNGGNNHTSTFNSNTLRDGAKHQIAITYDGTNARLYVDGTLIDTWLSAAPTLVSPMHWGRNGQATGTANYYAVTYDDVCMFSNTVAGADISAIWAAT